MSFLSSRGDSPPVKDPGLGIRGLEKLKSQLGREMEVLDQLEASLNEPSQAGASPQEITRDHVRRQLFYRRVGWADASYWG